MALEDFLLTLFAGRVDPVRQSPRASVLMAGGGGGWGGGRYWRDAAARRISGSPAVSDARGTTKRGLPSRELEERGSAPRCRRRASGAGYHFAVNSRRRVKLYSECAEEWQPCRCFVKMRHLKFSNSFDYTVRRCFDPLVILSLCGAPIGAAPSSSPSLFPAHGTQRLHCV